MVNFKKRFAEFCRKTTGYADMLMMNFNLPVHGHIHEFTKETLFCNCYWFCTDSTMVAKKLQRISN